MPKPFTAHPGSGMHTHFSLFEGDTNAFYRGRRRVPALQDRPAVHRRPPQARPRVHGGDQPVRELVQAALGRGRGPSYLSWGHNNRSALVRVPLYKPGKGQSARIEYRGIDSAANPYLAYAVLLGAGLKGIEEGYELPAAAEDDIWSLSSAERRAMGHDPLPASLHDAIRTMEDSELMPQILGEQVFEHFLRNKRAEWQDYRLQVTPYELQRNLGIL